MKRLLLVVTIAAFAATTMAPAIFAQTAPATKSDTKSGKHTDKNHNKGAPKKQPQ